MKKQHGIKNGFTLIELLVVVTILGLLAIVVLPAFTAGGDKRLLRGAAERLDTHLKHAAARATGKPRGSAVWLDAKGATAVFDLNFARMPTGKSSKGTVTPRQNNRFADVVPKITATQWSVIRFDMTPTEYQISSDEEALDGSSIITFADGYNEYNATFPRGPIDYVVYDPPAGPSIATRPTAMPNRACVDLASSTIGVHNFSESVTNFVADDASYFDRIALVFDVQGRLCEVWASNSEVKRRFDITASDPVALLVTLGYQSGLAYVPYGAISEDNPGAGYQNPDAFWVVIDPKTGRNLIVENNFQASDLIAAQEFVAKDLKAE